MDKFGRKYVLSVQTQSGEKDPLLLPALTSGAFQSPTGVLTVKPPFTIEFDITRNIFGSANHSVIRVYNLSEYNRNQIRKDVNNFSDLRSFVFRAGYGENLPIAFAGNIQQAWSVREGTNWITEIIGQGGGYAFVNGFTAQSFPADTPQASIIRALAGSLPGVALGTIGDYPGASSRGAALNGSTTDLLNSQTGGGFFIDNGKANCLNSFECLKGDLELINAKSGLLGTPVREQLNVHFDMLFEPRLVVGQRVKLESVGDFNFNGYYKVISLGHRGMISDAVCGDAITSVGLLTGRALTLVGA